MCVQELPLLLQYDAGVQQEGGLALGRKLSALELEEGGDESLIRERALYIKQRTLS